MRVMPVTGDDAVCELPARIAQLEAALEDIASTPLSAVLEGRIGEIISKARAARSDQGAAEAVEAAKRAYIAYSLARNAERDDVDRIVHWGEADAARVYDAECSNPTAGESFRRIWDAVAYALSPRETTPARPEADDERVQREAARPLRDWHEDYGFVVWWAWKNGRWLGEPAWIGTPNDSDWPGYHTHWTPHPVMPERTVSKQARRALLRKGDAA